MLEYKPSPRMRLAGFGRSRFKLSVVRQTKADLIQSVLAREWGVMLEPGYGTFADGAARAVANAKSEDEALLVAAASGSPADLVFRYGRPEFEFDLSAPLVEILDADSRETLWKRDAGET